MGRPTGEMVGRQGAPSQSGGTPTLLGQLCPLTKAAAPWGSPWFKKTKDGEENRSERHSVHLWKKEEGPCVFSLSLHSSPWKKAWYIWVSIDDLAVCGSITSLPCFEEKAYSLLFPAFSFVAMGSAIARKGGASTVRLVGKVSHCCHMPNLT